MLTCPYCQTENSNQVTQCVTCGSSLGSDELPNGTLLFGDTLEVHGVLGRGGFGIVYKALHLEKQKYVAIKELFPEGLATRGYNNQVQVSSQAEMKAAIARTSREAQMLRKLKHPSATKLFAYWEENSTAYMALELLEGQTLESRIQNGQLLTAEEAKSALLTILEVLEELHSHGFLHRDIKPANIMFTPTRVELIDFGSLTEFRKGERTKVSSRIATPEYAPLEQFGSEVTLSPATDLYALAATFCEAMTGSRVPSALDRANGASLEPSMLAVQRVSRELADILEKALELRMEFRFENTARMTEMLNYIERPVSAINPLTSNLIITPKTRHIIPQLIRISLDVRFALIFLFGLPAFLLLYWALFYQQQPMSIEAYHAEKRLHFENLNLHTFSDYENLVILKYPKKIGQYIISLDDYHLSDNMMYMVIKESFCSDNSCQSYLRFENIQEKRTEAILKWISSKGSAVENTKDNKAYFRYANNHFFLVNSEGLFQVFSVKGKQLYSYELNNRVSFMSISDDNSFIFIKRDVNQQGFSRLNTGAFYVFQLEKPSFWGLISFDEADDFFVISTPKSRVGMLSKQGEKYSYSECILANSCKFTGQPIDFLTPSNEIIVFREGEQSTLILSGKTKNTDSLIIKIRRLSSGQIQKIWEVRLSENEFAIEPISKQKMAVFSTRLGEKNLKIIDLYSGLEVNKPYDGKNTYDKKSIRQKGILYFHHFDNQYNYIQIVKSNLVQ